MKTKNLLISNPSLASLNEELNQRLVKRFGPGTDCTDDEIMKVTNLDCRLFPENFAIDEETTKTYRLLCRFSQCGMKGLENSIKSHRPVIGVLIVKVKKLIWRFFASLLEKQFAGLQEFCSISVTEQARARVALQQMREEKRA